MPDLVYKPCCVSYDGKKMIKACVINFSGLHISLISYENGVSLVEFGHSTEEEDEKFHSIECPALQQQQGS